MRSLGVVLLFTLPVLHCAHALQSGVVGHVAFDRPVATVDPSATELAEFRWTIGDRSLPTVGVKIPPGGAPFFFALPAPDSDRLTLELREFRTMAGQSPAYVISVNGRDVAFRCRGYDEAGFASAFLDLPPISGDAGVRIGIRNVAPTPLHLSGACLYHDLETHVRAAGLWEPMFTGPSIRIGEGLTERLRNVRRTFSGHDDVRPMCVVATFALGQWPLEKIEENLDLLLGACRESGVPVEIQFNTWWAGTPSGFDGRGGRWVDPEYQQVTYDPDIAQYALSVPNRWSNTPWLTLRNRRLNQFKRDRFDLAGRVLRERYDRAQSKGADLPITGIVLDNEVTYWAAGMPDMARNLQADFNPSMVRAARAEGVVLDPADGLAADETGFLRRSLLVYNREMARGIVQGLGNCPLRERVYTHAWVHGAVFDHPIQAVGAGVLEEIRVGTECSFRHAAEVAHMDVIRELGVPTAVNIELGGQKTACEEVPFSFATGCRRASLFNAGDELLDATAAATARGWPEYPPVPWRPKLLEFDFEEGCPWRDYFTVEGADVAEICPITRNGIRANEVDTSGTALLRLNAAELIAEDAFRRLALSCRVRAFVFQHQNDDACLVVRAGQSPDALRELRRFANTTGVFQVDLTEVAAGASTVFVEFEFHPLVLTGWVALFDLAVEVPWEEEGLLLCNRSYGAERLRAESLLTGWRADAAWALTRCSGLASGGQAGTAAAAARAAFDAGDFRDAYAQACAAIEGGTPDSRAVVPRPPPDREERGQVAGVQGNVLSFHPYEEGTVHRRLELTPDTDVAVQVNGASSVGVTKLLPGDDVRITVQDGTVVRVRAARGVARGTVEDATPVTPFQLPMLRVADLPVLPICSRARVVGRDGEHRKGTCWLATGDLPFEPGDAVAVRWNPHTKRIVDVREAAAEQP